MFHSLSAPARRQHRGCTSLETREECKRGRWATKARMGSRNICTPPNRKLLGAHYYNNNHSLYHSSSTVERIEHRWLPRLHSTRTRIDRSSNSNRTTHSMGSITCTSYTKSTVLCCHSSTECKDKQNTVVSQQDSSSASVAQETSNF